jgi:hypothetical protein
MKLRHLEYLTPTTLAAGQAFYRVQRRRSSSQTVQRGPLKLAPAGTLSGRFDLTHRPTAYLAEAPDTAIYEAVFRREAIAVSLAKLATQSLLAVQLLHDLVLGDLRPHASAWPVLQSLRQSETQELAAEAHAAGYAGLLYRSAQQHGQDCMALFDPPTGAFKTVSLTQLVNPNGAINRWVAVAVRGSRVPLVP